MACDGQRPRCLITGATGGLGQALALAFCQAGYHTIVSGRRSWALEALLADLKGRGEATAVVCDVSKIDELHRLFQETNILGTGLDVVIANAGQAAGGSFVNPGESLEKWQDMVLTNVFGVAATARLAIPALIRARGRLILIGSIVGRTVVAGDLYSVTKHAVSALAEALRGELQGTGVLVSIVQPGLMDTPLVSAERRVRPMMNPDEVAAEILRMVTPDRAFHVDEIVMRACALASDKPAEEEQ
jgi:NAD(P)-dependent dehydrogenase (short-subunit alcohol dehydrogenase family)